MSKVKSDQTPHYEMLYIVSPDLTEEEVKPIVARVEETIAKFNGEVTYTEVWGKKTLAYPIGRMHYGYYFLAEFDCQATEAKNIDQEFRLSTEIVRHMIVSKPKRTREQIAEEKRKDQERVEKELESKKQEKEESKKPEEKPKPKKAVDLADLDEKLDRILETDDLL